jgi:hypothetical protein
MIDPARPSRLGILLLGCGLVLGASCARGPVKTLVSGDLAVRIGSDGTVLSIVSPGGTVKAAGRRGAGLVACGGRTFPLTAPVRLTPAERGIRFVYDIKELSLEIELTYRLEPGKGAVVFSRDIALRSNSPLPDDLTISVATNPLALPDATWLPLKNGVGSDLGAAEAAVYRFAGLAPAAPLALAVPMVSFPAGPPAARCTLMTDPFYSTVFRRTSVEWTYPKSVGLENGLERRTISTVFHQGDPDAAIGRFYDVALAEIPPGPEWLHDIAMVGYDYLSGGGRGWFEDVDALEAAIPAADRSKVLLALHGWYDFVGRYSFSPETGALDPQWTAFSNFPNVKKAFPRSVPVALTLKNMHERMRYAAARGFRVALYFADGMSAGDGLAGIYQPDRVLYWGGWVGPDTKGKTYCQNPLHPAVRSFFIQYIKALLREFGGDIDALVWDETFHVDTGSLGSEKVPGYADRALMRLVRDLAAEVHAYNRESGRSLAFLASDCIGVNKWVNKPPYALVADGTYQDTHCDPESWAYGLFPNYRNALWSCNWEPVTHFDYTEFGVREYQAAVAISNGYGDDVGFAEMTAEMKKKVLDLFNWRKETPTRLRWFSKLPVFLEKGGAASETK